MRGTCLRTTTARRQIEAIAAIEAGLDKPVANGNRALLWGCVKRLQGQLAPMPALGRLMRNSPERTAARAKALARDVDRET
jgi:maleate cis-trans isomerase